MELLKLFWLFLKLGLFTFGGGYAMIPSIKEMVVEKMKWLTEDEMLEIIAIAEATPGPIAINIATYIGYKQSKILGSIAATIGVILPSLIIIYLIFLFLEQYMNNIYIIYAFNGIKVGVAFLIIKTGMNSFHKLPKKPFSLGVFISVFALTVGLDLLSINFSSIYLIILCGTLSIVIDAIAKRKRGNR